jgi:hypothetical protein
MDIDFSTCPHCQYTESLCLDEAIDGGVVSEANYFCAKCFRHLAFFAYGSWEEGSGLVADEKNRSRLLQQLAQVETNEQHKYYMELHAQELHEASGYPLEQCSQALYDQRGNRDKALAVLVSGKVFQPSILNW